MRIAILLLLSAALMTACTTTPTNRAAEIVGIWESDLAGFTVTSVFSATDVSVDGHEAVAYQLAGNRLIIGGDDTSARIVSFPSGSEMIQVDPLTGTEHRYTKVDN